MRPVVLALAPPAPGLSRGDSVPCLERLGGARLIDRLLGTLDALGLPAPLVITEHTALSELRTTTPRSLPVLAVHGGREAALRAALEHSAEELLLVHDAERALTPGEVIREVLGALRAQDDAVVPVIGMTDSVKEVLPEGLRNIDRATLAGLQSPRLLRRGLLETVLGRADATVSSAEVEDFDEIRSALTLGGRVRTVHGSQSGFAVRDRLSLWRAQISLGLARDTSHHLGLSRRS